MHSNDLGAQLRHWRSHRRLSQLDLALGAGISARHLSFVETGRARPSPPPPPRAATLCSAWPSSFACRCASAIAC
jgi:transcriptional regulator with XRE-family HTH domain